MHGLLVNNDSFSDERACVAKWERERNAVVARTEHDITRDELYDFVAARLREAEKRAARMRAREKGRGIAERCCFEEALLLLRLS